MKENPRILSEINGILQSAPFATLATSCDSYPHCSLIGFISDEECRAIYFITGRGTRKFRNISVNPSVSLLVSTAEGRSSGFSEAAAITITGTASIIEGTPGEEILKRYSEKLPFLKEFLNFHDCAMIKVNVSGYLLVKNFQDTYEYEF